MIYSLKGTLQVAEPNFIVIHVSGVGFGVKTTLTTMSQLPKIGEDVFLFTHMNVREDAIELYGFASSSELNCYRMLISVNGVGPKAALSILSDLSPEQFALAVASGDAKSLTRSPGIGLKTAQRIVLELKDKIAKEQATNGVISQKSVITGNKNTSNLAEAISALVVLGYTQAEASSAIATTSSDASVEELIKAGLKSLAGN